MSTTKQLNRTLLVVYSTLLAGCASHIKYQISESVTITKRSFDLIDTRDDAQKKSKIFSLMATNCLYGIYRIGDDQIVPSRLSILSNALEERMGSKLQGKIVVVKRFEIFNNLQKPTRESAASLAGAASVDASAGAMSADIIRNACEGTMARENNPNNDPSIIVVVDVDIDGVNITDRIVQLEPAGVVNAYAKNDLVLTERIKRAVLASIKNVIDTAQK